MMDDPLEIAEVVRQACITAALCAYDDAGLSGLCHETLGVCGGCDVCPAAPLAAPGPSRSAGERGARSVPPQVIGVRCGCVGGLSLAARPGAGGCRPPCCSNVGQSARHVAVGPR